MGGVWDWWEGTPESVGQTFMRREKLLASGDLSKYWLMGKDLLGETLAVVRGQKWRASMRVGVTSLMGNPVSVYSKLKCTAVKGYLCSKTIFAIK